MNKILYLCFVLFFLFTYCQTYTGDEKLEDWIFPKTDNFKWFKTTSSENGFENIDLKTKIFYLRTPDNKFATLSCTFLNNFSGVSEGMLFELNNNKLLLKKDNKGGIKGMVKSQENSFNSNNIYLKLPSKNDTIKWEYSKENNTYVKCSSYWSSDENNLKMLIVEREEYVTNGKPERLDKLKEYYSKDVGLTKIESYGKSDKKILMVSRITESGIDPEAKPEKLKLFTNQTEKKIIKPIEQLGKIEWIQFGSTNEYKLLLPIFFKKGILVASGTLQYYDNDIDDNISLTVEGFGNGAQSDLIQTYKNDLEIYKNISYKVFKSNWYVMSGKNNDGFYYNKTIIKNGEQYHLRINYPLDKKVLFDKILPEISTSFN